MRLMMGSLLLAAAAPAAAQDLRDFCGDRPGLGSPACTVDPGHLQVEVGLGDWTLDKQPDSRTDTILAGDILARYGVGPSTELRLGWTSFGHVRERDRQAEGITRANRVGDVTLGLKQNLMNPSGDDLSIALLPTVTLPVGREPVGTGTWSAGVQVPVDYELSKAVQLQLTTDMDASADEDGHGRHLTYGGVAGVGIDLTRQLNLDLEVQALRDRDPDGHSTQLLGAVAFAYQPQDQTQLDVGTALGLNHQSPDVELYFGISRKF